MTDSEGAWDRTATLLGEEALESFRKARVLIAGLGGVGGYAAETLARCAVGYLRIVDADEVAPSNLNRQLIALRSTVGQPKAALFARRIADINPDAETDPREEFITPDNVSEFLEGIDIVVDAIDTVAPKVALIAECMRRGLPIVSAMGAGGRCDPSKLVYADLWETRDDGLARAVRQRLKKMGLRRKLTVVASTEVPRKAPVIEENKENKRTSPGTTPFVAPTAGIFLGAKAAEIILTNYKRCSNLKT